MKKLRGETGRFITLNQPLPALTLQDLESRPVSINKLVAQQPLTLLILLRHLG